MEFHHARKNYDPLGKIALALPQKSPLHKEYIEDFWADCRDNFDLQASQHSCMSKGLMKVLDLQTFLKGFLDDGPLEDPTYKEHGLDKLDLPPVDWTTPEDLTIEGVCHPILEGSHQYFSEDTPKKTTDKWLMVGELGLMGSIVPMIIMVQTPLVTLGGQTPWSTFVEVVKVAALLNFGQKPHPPLEDIPMEENILGNEANEAEEQQ